MLAYDFLYFFFWLFATITMTTLEVKKPTLANLASGAFVKGPQDDAATVDVYALGTALTKDKKKLFTSVQSISTDADESLYSFINNPTQISDFITSADKNGNLGIDESTLMYRLTQTSTDVKHAFTDLTADIKNSAKITMSKESRAKVQCVVDDVRTMVSASKIKDINSLGNFVNKYTGSNTFNKKDTGAVSALLASVVAKTQELGIADVYTKFTSTIQDNDILRNLTKILVPVAIARNYPNLLRQISYGPYAKIANMVAPGMMRDFVRNYSLKGSSGFGRPISTFDDLLGTVERTTAGWGKSKREGSDEDVFDITDLLGGSRDFQRLLATGVGYFYTGASKQAGHIGSVGYGPISQNMPGAFDRITTSKGHQVYAVYGLAGFYQQITAAAAVRKYFPKVALTGTYDMSIPVVRTNRARTVRTAPRSSAMDARFINHAIASLF